MRTTVNIDSNLLTEAKQMAAKTGRSLGEVIQDALRETLSRPRRTDGDLLDLPVYGSGGIQPGVDIDDSASLLELMERPKPRRLKHESPPLLTSREAEILRRAATGATKRDIAQDLGIAVDAVRTHLERIFEKLGAHSPREVSSDQDTE